MVTGLLGGLALFLFGLEHMTGALRVVAGDRLKSLLAAWTRNRLTAVASGTVITALVQSSSVTTVLVVGFVSAGVMRLSQSVGVIMGANIGSTVTAQIIAFKVTTLAWALVAAGYLAQAALRRPNGRHWGLMVLGLGLIFAGMDLMSSAMAPLREYEGFTRVMASLGERSLLGAAIGLVFTAVVQSSAATVGLVLALAGQQLIGLEAAIAVVLGSNVGTCITAMLATIGRPREAVRAAVVHVLFNVLGAALFFPFIDHLAWLALAIDDHLPRSIANAHTLFNVIGTLVFLPAAPLFARAATRLVPERRQVDEAVAGPQPRYLDPALLLVPSTALDAATREISRMAVEVRLMAEILAPPGAGQAALPVMAEAETKIDIIQKQVIDYLGRLSAGDLGHEDGERLLRLMALTNALEHVSDCLAEHTRAVEERLRTVPTPVSERTQQVIHASWSHLRRMIRLIETALVRNDGDQAKAALGLKAEVHRAFDELELRIAQRISSGDPDRLALYRLESDILEWMRTLHSSLRRAAKAELAVLPGYLSGMHPVVAHQPAT